VAVLLTPNHSISIQYTQQSLSNQAMSVYVLWEYSQYGKCSQGQLVRDGQLVWDDWLVWDGQLI